jgi:hypothetical protein
VASSDVAARALGHENLARNNAPIVWENNNQLTKEVRRKVLSRDCDGCGQMQPCRKRYFVVKKGNKVYCPDGTAHLVDGM